MKAYVFHIPGPPGLKRRPRFSGGRARTPEKTRREENALAWEVRVQMLAFGLHGPLHGALRVGLVLTYPMPESWSQVDRARMRGTFHTRTPDLDNAIKLLDGLNGVLWNDDRQIAHITAEKVWGDLPGATELTVTLADTPYAP